MVRHPGNPVIDNSSYQVDSTQCQRLCLRRGQPVNCSYITPPPTASKTRLPRTDTAWTLFSEATVAPLSLDFPLVISQFGWPNPMAPDEKILLHHLCAIRKDMILVTERGFSVGISQFSRYIRQILPVFYTHIDEIFNFQISCHGRQI
jgi:hypothetical protein